MKKRAFQTTAIRSRKRTRIKQTQTSISTIYHKYTDFLCPFSRLSIYPEIPNTCPQFNNIFASLINSSPHPAKKKHQKQNPPNTQTNIPTKMLIILLFFSVSFRLYFMRRALSKHKHTTIKNTMKSQRKKSNPDKSQNKYPKIVRIRNRIKTYKYKQNYQKSYEQTQPQLLTTDRQRRHAITNLNVLPHARNKNLHPPQTHIRPTLSRNNAHSPSS